MISSESIKISGGSNIFNGHGDRYVAGGYKDRETLAYRVEKLAAVGGITGIDLGGGSDITASNALEVKGLLTKHNLIPVAITPNLNGERQFAFGSVCSPDPQTREQAWLNMKDSIDSARLIGCNLINLWLGQDGFDYCFQVDYLKEFDRLISFLQKAADYDPEVRISVEYKALEPRKRLFTSSAGVTLALIGKAARPNLGITMDNGHAWNAGENIAETICLLKTMGDRLFYIHINDNHKADDDDMIVGSVHIVETLEFLYWLDRIGYKGFYNLDVDPAKESAMEFARENVAMLRKLKDLARSLGEGGDLESAFATADPSRAVRLVRERILK